MPMQLENSSLTSFLDEITISFPQEEMPSKEKLCIHRDNCRTCADLRDDLDETRGKEITGDVFRIIHQELSCLSAKGWRWILPYYLRYCLSEEGQESQMETEFLIYQLSPSDEFKDDSIKRFAFLQQNQIECLLHFLDRCSAHPYWNEYFTEDLNKAKYFLCKLSETQQPA
jgi:hypothetical protein